jgi:hypothetical protein
VLDACLLWNSTRFVLEPEGEGNSMPPLQVVFAGHGAAAAAAAASCAAFTLWACASIGTTIHTHTLLTGPFPILPRSLRDYLHANGASHLSLRLSHAAVTDSSKHLPLSAHSCFEVDATTFRTRLLPADAVADDDDHCGGKSDSGGSKTGCESLRNVLARSCMQRQRGYE